MSKILEVPIEDIYESEDTNLFICQDQSVGINNGTSNVYAIPEDLLTTQQKYITKLEEEITYLKGLLAETK